MLPSATRDRPWPPAHGTPSDLPLATRVAIFHGHHRDVAYDAYPSRFRLGAANLDHPFPRQAPLTAMVLVLAELGLVD